MTPLVPTSTALASSVKLPTAALLAGFAVAGAVAWQLGGSAGAGAALGAAVATATSVLGTLALARAFVRRPDLALPVTMGAFLAKLVLVAGGSIALAELAGWSERADPTAYLLGFAAVVLWAMVVQVAFPVVRPAGSPRRPKELPTS